MATVPPETLSCSFCRKSQREVKKLIAGPNVHICDECLGLCNDIVAEEIAKERIPLPLAPSLVDLIGHFDSLVVGQVAAKRSLVAAVRLHFLRAMDESRMRVPRVLLLGPRGSGKTTLGRALCSSTKLPSYHADVSRLSESGYVGEDIEHFLLALSNRSAEPEHAHVGVLFLDGFEKIKAERPLARSRDISGEGVQRELHRLLDGLETEVPQIMGARHPQKPTEPFRCDRLMIAAAVRVDDLPPKASERMLREAAREVGILPEIVARFDAVVQTDPLTVEELEAILNVALVSEAQRTVQPLGGTLDVRPEAARIIASAAFRSGDGAWGLHPPMARLMTMLFASSQSMRDIVVDPAAAENLVAG